MGAILSCATDDPTDDPTDYPTVKQFYRNQGPNESLYNVCAVSSAEVKLAAEKMTEEEYEAIIAADKVFRTLSEAMPGSMPESHSHSHWTANQQKKTL